MVRPFNHKWARQGGYRDPVLCNFVGPSGSTTSRKVGNVLKDTLLAPTDSFSLDGLFNGEIIGGGKSIVLLSGARVNEVPFSPPSSGPASIAGFVWEDDNGNGVVDSGEACWGA